MQLCPANENAFAASFAAVPGGRVAADDRRSRVAELELDALAVRAFGEAPADPARPVNVISFTRSSSTSTSPIADGRARDDVEPARRAGRPPPRVSARKSADNGVADAGLSTTAQPAASAGATLCATRLSGKLNGEIAPTIPIGSRSVNASFPSPAGRRVHRHDLAGEPARLDSGEREGGGRALCLDPGRLQRLARLGGDRSAPPPPARSSSSRAVASRIRARSCAGSGVAHRALRGVERPPRLGCAASGDAPDELARVRRAHLGPVAGLHRSTVDQQRMIGIDRRPSSATLIFPRGPESSPDRRPDAVGARHRSP